MSLEALLLRLIAWSACVANCATIAQSNRGAGQNAPSEHEDAWIDARIYFDSNGRLLSDDDILHLFSTLDTNGDGRITLQEVRAVEDTRPCMTCMACTAASSSGKLGPAAELLRAADADGSHTIEPHAGAPWI